MKVTSDESGEEIEVYTADEFNAAKAAAAAEVEGRYKPQVEELNGKLTAAEQRAVERSREFQGLRKLSDEAVSKLSDAERVIYENGLALQKANEDREAADKRAQQALVDGTLKAKAGTNEKLYGKMKEMWDVIGINATTPQEIEQKTLVVLGAISAQEPNLVATVAGFSGSYKPPETNEDGKSFADTTRGKAAAKELGLDVK